MSASLDTYETERAIAAIVAWARARRLPDDLVAKLPRLAERNDTVTREIADELAELGYPFTANDLRQAWRAPT